MRRTLSIFGWSPEVCLLRPPRAQGQDLHRWQLGSADLRNAGAYLFKADLSGADLRGASFSAALEGTVARFDRFTAWPFSADETEELATR